MSWFATLVEQRRSRVMEKCPLKTRAKCVRGTATTPRVEMHGHWILYTTSLFGLPYWIAQSAKSYEFRGTYVLVARTHLPPLGPSKLLTYDNSSRDCASCDQVESVQTSQRDLSDPSGAFAPDPGTHSSLLLLYNWMTLRLYLCRPMNQGKQALIAVTSPEAVSVRLQDRIDAHTPTSSRPR